MPRRHVLAATVFLTISLAPAASFGQAVPGLTLQKSFRIDRLGPTHWKLTGEVEIEQEDMEFFADEIDYYSDTGRVEAIGNVVYTSAEGRIASERMEFDTRSRTGTFYNAAGTASLGDRVDRSMFGTQEPDAYFYGQTIEKIGPAKYRITRGGFTTCVQPTPRWEMTANTVTITLDEYAVLKNPVLRVKGVPLFYAPILYYPINRDDRATGLLIPVYGSSTIRGQSLSNAFFWAINRSQDVTLFHDWYTRTGHGYGSEYRYASGPGSEGSARVYLLNEREATFTDDDGRTNTSPARRSYEVRAAGVQTLGSNWVARGNVDYFSDITVQQTFHQNLYDASRRSRTYGGNVSGSWGANSLSGTFDLTQLFYGTTDTTTYGGTPRVSYSRSAQAIGNSPVYFSLGSEFVRLERRSETETRLVDQGLVRMGAAPSLRVPVSRWPFLTINSYATWNHTYYTESLDAERQQVADPLYRQYLDVGSEIVGPVFTRIWDTPTNGYASRIKHVIEPSVALQRVTPIEDFNRIVKLESTDYAVGDMTKFVYGLTNRFLAKRRESSQDVTREFINVSVFQTYYTDPEASRFDSAFPSSFGGREPSQFSPVLIQVRGEPTASTSGTLLLEYDHQISQLRTIQANGVIGSGEVVSASGGWSRRLLDESRYDNFVNGATALNLFDGRIGGTYGFHYDFARETLLQQRFVGFYNAQCCGIAFEFQAYNFPTGDPRFPVTQDRRFNVSFTLAGIGTFSNLLGALSGNDTRSR